MEATLFDEISDVNYAVPLAVVAGCLVLILLTTWLRRDRTPRWSIDETSGAPSDASPINRQDLAIWHQDFAPGVAEWLAAHESLLAHLGDSQLAVDLTDGSITAEHDRLHPQLVEATSAHPAPVMRAELSAMAVAADATIHAVRRSDYETAERQHVTYCQYRDLWIDRLRQFSIDDPSMAELRTNILASDGLVIPTEESATDTE